MFRLDRLMLIALASGSLGCQGADVPQVNVGLNQPPPGVAQAFSWERIPGASAYQVVVSLDMAGVNPVGTSGFTADTHMTLQSVAWRPGHPVADRPYFWTMRAFDRPDPQGVLLTIRGPHQVQFDRGSLPIAPAIESPDPVASP